MTILMKAPKYMEAKDIDTKALKNIQKSLIELQPTMKKDICILSEEVFLNGKKISVPLVFFNNTDAVVQNLEIQVRFSIFNQLIFEGPIAFKKDFYDELRPGEGILDYWILEFDGDLEEKEITKLNQDEFNFEVFSCHEITYQEA